MAQERSQRPADGWVPDENGRFDKVFGEGARAVRVSVGEAGRLEDAESFLRQIDARMAVLSDGVPDRNVLLAALADNKALCENLAHTVDRCSKLLEYGRAARKRIIELGGEDPGSP